MAGLMSANGKSLAQLVDERISAFPCSGEINYRVANVQATIEKIRNAYLHLNPAVDTTDGLSMDFGTWRFNLRGSNTEPLLRLNVETRADQAALSLQLSRLEELLLGETQ